MDASIAESADFAKPILERIRQTVLPACPEVQEAMKCERNVKARAAFQGFSPRHQREYLEWITEAKGEATRTRRLATAVDWIAEGKPRHWKYLRQRSP
ncbi:MAG TPA: YdeI/OmpD-associated family protein [Gemmatimonadales bacterium]|nr:YdeI/OmpD-associated family protein [Gemmatimonadales bacterium]